MGWINSDKSSESVKTMQRKKQEHAGGNNECESIT